VLKIIDLIRREAVCVYVFSHYLWFKKPAGERLEPAGFGCSLAVCS
jgi:hypothetical protein